MIIADLNEDLVYCVLSHAALTDAANCLALNKTFHQASLRRCMQGNEVQETIHMLRFMRIHVSKRTALHMTLRSTYDASRDFYICATCGDPVFEIGCCMCHRIRNKTMKKRGSHLSNMLRCMQKAVSNAYEKTSIAAPIDFRIYIPLILCVSVVNASKIYNITTRFVDNWCSW